MNGSLADFASSMDWLTIELRCGLSMSSFSAAKRDTLPKTNLNSLRYRLDRSMLDPISCMRASRYSTKMVAKMGDVTLLARKELAMIWRA